MMMFMAITRITVPKALNVLADGLEGFFLLLLLPELSLSAVRTLVDHITGLVFLFSAEATGTKLLLLHATLLIGGRTTLSLLLLILFGRICLSLLRFVQCSQSFRLLDLPKIVTFVAVKKLMPFSLDASL
jgi:hypothetical protein